LIGADGIWSRVRHQIYDLPMNEVGPEYAEKHARYSGYSCFTGTCQHIPEDIEGNFQQQFFGCADTGHGYQHCWAFLLDPPGAGHSDTEPILDRLRRDFEGWSL
jgi:2-polyprenyl-6-methoxyphenol hydroxylase-like FAD-dependent oxidoreductase